MSTDARRVRSFVGLVIGRLGPRADGAVTGTFLTLVVAQRTSSLFLVTFALSAHRLLHIISYPLIGRISDRTDTRAGRRTPFMAAGLLVMAASTLLYNRVGGYWLLVALVVVARQSRVAYSLPGFAAVPEVFGRSRWIRALLAIGVSGAVVGLLVRLTVIATWEEGNPASWSPAFDLAAGFMVAAGLAVLFLVREAPAAREAARHVPNLRWRERLDDLLAVPNARVLVAASLLGSAAVGATSRSFPVYARETLGATASDLAASGLIAGPAGFVVGALGGYWLSTFLPRRLVVVLAPVGGAIVALVHVVLTDIWQSVAVGVVAAPLVVAFAIAIAPLALQLLPRSGSMGERFGIFVGPLSLAGVVSGLAASLAYDHVVRDYRIIWLFPAALLLAAAVVLRRLEIPPGVEHADVFTIIERVRSELSAAQPADRSLFGGEVTADDVDPMAVFDMAREAAMPTTARQGLARRLLDLPVTLDGAVIEAVAELLADDVVYRGPEGAVEGRAAVLEKLIERQAGQGEWSAPEGGGDSIVLRRGPETVTVVYEDDRVVAVEWESDERV